MLKYLGGTSLLVLCLSSAAMAQDDHAHDDVTLYRVFVGDHQQGRVTAFDLTEPDNRWTFQTKGQSKLYPIAGGAGVAAVQSDDEQVNFFSSGISLQDHGDHADIAVTDPAAVAQTLTGPRPFHLVAHGGKLAVNYDLGGYAEILDESAVAQGAIKAERFPQARAHHGFVAPLGNVWLSTVASDAPVQGDAAPPRVGLQAFDAAGKPVGDLATCTGIHGEAFSGAYLVAGCKEGVLTATKADGGVKYDMLPYPADFPQDVTTGTLLGSKVIQVFLGNHGADGLVVVDPVDEPHMRRIALPFRRVDFTMDPMHPAHAYVLTEDGQMHRVNILDARIEASARVTGPYSMDGHWNDPRPRIAMAGDDIVVTDPQAGVVRRIAKKDLSEIAATKVEGVPYNLAVVGGSGISH